MKKITLFTFFILLFITNINNTFADEEKNLVNIYIFHSDSCSHCQEELKLLDKLEKKYNNIKIHKYEIIDEHNKELFSKVTNEFNITTTGVPFTIIGDKYFIGYSEKQTKLTFVKTIIYYSNYGYMDKVAGIVGNDELPSYKVSEDQPTIDNFIKNYGNYKLLFFNTNNMSLENINLLSHMLSELNIYNIIMTTILVLILINLKNPKDKWVSVIIYIILYIVQSLFYQINKLIINEIILLLILNYLAYSILLYIVKNNKTPIIYSIIAIISTISNYLKTNYYSKYLIIWKEIIELNCLNLLEYIIQILLSIIIILFITIIIIYMINLILKKILKIKIRSIS